jgi:hypothetical protein
MGNQNPFNVFVTHVLAFEYLVYINSLHVFQTLVQIANRPNFSEPKSVPDRAVLHASYWPKKVGICITPYDKRFYLLSSVHCD